MLNTDEWQLNCVFTIDKARRAIEAAADEM
jgi:hypothetical protein